VVLNHKPVAKKVSLGISDDGSTVQVINTGTAKRLKFSRNGSRIEIPLELMPRHGCVLSLLPEVASKLSCACYPKKVNAGETVKFTIGLFAKSGKRVVYSTPVRLVLTSVADKSLVLYDEYKLMKKGQFVFSLNLPINLPSGEYKFKATTPIGGLSTSTAFVVVR